MEIFLIDLPSNPTLIGFKVNFFQDSCNQRRIVSPVKKAVFLLKNTNCFKEESSKVTKKISVSKDSKNH